MRTPPKSEIRSISLYSEEMRRTEPTVLFANGKWRYYFSTFWQFQRRFGCSGCDAIEAVLHAFVQWHGLASVVQTLVVNMAIVPAPEFSMT